MSTWPLLNRNKVLDSKVHVAVEACLSLENESIKALSQKVCWSGSIVRPHSLIVDQLLDHWNSLPIYKRIAKRQIGVSNIFGFDMSPS